MLALLVILTAPSEGRDEVVLEGHPPMKLSRPLRRMRLHRLLNHEAAPALN